jgi:hypothetical protein
MGATLAQAVADNSECDYELNAEGTRLPCRDVDIACRKHDFTCLDRMVPTLVLVCVVHGL